MNQIERPEFIDNVGNYLKTTNARGLLLHVSEQPSPYSDFDFYLVFGNVRDRRRFVYQRKEHAHNLGNVIPARLVLNCATPNGVFSIFKQQDKVVKIDINTETMRSVQESSSILGSSIVFDDTGRLQDYLGAKKETILKKNFYTPSTELQAILEQYYAFNWNALSKIWKADYRLVAFELVPIYLRMIAQLEHASNGSVSTNYYNSNNNMRPETTRKLNEIEIRPQREALIATLKKLQVLFHDLGTEVAEKNNLVYPNEAEELFLEGLKEL